MILYNLNLLSFCLTRKNWSLLEKVQILLNEAEFLGLHAFKLFHTINNSIFSCIVFLDNMST